MSMNNQKTWIVIVGLAIVIGGVAFLGNDFPAGDDQASGTIVPAERYRGEQIASDDVELGDESVAQLMQTDLFEQIVSDPAFAEAMRSDAFRAAMASDAFRTAMASDAFRTAMSSDSFADSLLFRCSWIRARATYPMACSGYRLSPRSIQFDACAIWDI